jgi:hypothetical protein
MIMHTQGMTATGLTAALLIGVLLPVSFARPGHLRAVATREHTRRRLDYLYTCFAFAAMGYVYTTAATLIHVRNVPTTYRNALAGGGLILLMVALATHLPPLLTSSAKRVKATLVCITAVGLGLTTGGFLAIDEIFNNVHHPVLAATSWAVLALLTYTAASWHSGLSPSTQLHLYARRKRRMYTRRMPGRVQSVEPPETALTRRSQTGHGPVLDARCKGRG